MWLEDEMKSTNMQAFIEKNFVSGCFRWKKDKNGRKSLYEHNAFLHLLKDSIVIHFMEHAPHKL